MEIGAPLIVDIDGVVSAPTDLFPDCMDQNDKDNFLSILYSVEFLEDRWFEQPPIRMCCTFEQDNNDEPRRGVVTVCFPNIFVSEIEIRTDCNGRITFLDIDLCVDTGDRDYQGGIHYAPYALPGMHIEGLTELRTLLLTRCTSLPVQLASLPRLERIDMDACNPELFLTVPEGLQRSASIQEVTINMRNARRSSCRFFEGLPRTVRRLMLRNCTWIPSELENLEELEEFDFEPMQIQKRDGVVLGVYVAKPNFVRRFRPVTSLRMETDLHENYAERAVSRLNATFRNGGVRTLAEDAVNRRGWGSTPRRLALLPVGFASGALPPDRRNLWPFILQREYNHTADVYAAARYSGNDNDQRLTESKRSLLLPFLLIRDNYLLQSED